MHMLVEEPMHMLVEEPMHMLVEDPMAYAAVSQLAEEGWSSVHLAAGTVAGQLGVSAGDALAVLRSYAFASDAQLREGSTRRRCRPRGLDGLPIAHGVVLDLPSPLFPWDSPHASAIPSRPIRNWRMAGS
jgi:hypothetical protein